MKILKRTVGNSGKALQLLVEEFSAQQPVRATLKGLIHHGRHAGSGFVARNLREQLCVRLCHQLQRLKQFPQSTRHSRQLQRVHESTFQELYEMEGVVDNIVHDSRQDSLNHQLSFPLDDFRRRVDAVNNRHASNVEALMEAKMEMGHIDLGLSGELRFQRLIDDFLQMHISFQLLCRHYLLSLKAADTKNESSRTGMVAESCLLHDVVADAIGETQLITEHHLADSPDVIIEGEVGTRISCIPSHVHHILFEILKNALRATALSHTSVGSSLPPVRIRISKGKGEVTICVSDEGGGMGARTSLDAFRYLWTSSETYRDTLAKHCANSSYQPAIDPLSGMGIGLPVSRLYARHFGGDLRLLSLPGYGTHVAFFLPAMVDAAEQLPHPVGVVADHEMMSTM